MSKYKYSIVSIIKRGYYDVAAELINLDNDILKDKGMLHMIRNTYSMGADQPLVKVFKNVHTSNPLLNEYKQDLMYLNDTTNNVPLRTIIKTRHRNYMVADFEAFYYS